MFLSYFTLLTALSLSMVAAWYSILGLTAIFASAVIPIIIMGSILEVAKVTVTVWLHEYWPRCRLLMKIYLVPAVGMLMVITSMGIFGFLSKAHSDQNLISGDVQSKIAIYDEKIKTQKENIEANRKALKQMDEGVDSVLGRSADEKGADKAVALRRAQQKERVRLQAEILQSQKSIAELTDARAPIAAEVRKVEAEVGPIKYIAALIYGDNPDANVLERAVRWVIIILVVVFDPLAIMMVLAATESLKWERERRLQPAYEADDGPLTDEQVAQLRATAEPELPTGEVVETSKLFDEEPKDPHPPGWMYDGTTPYPLTEADVEEIVAEFDQIKQAVTESVVTTEATVNISIPDVHPDDQLHQLAKNHFMSGQPDADERTYHAQHQAGEIDILPWHQEEHINSLPISDRERKQLIERFVNPVLEARARNSELDTLRLEADNAGSQLAGEVRGFGTQFPLDAKKGDMFLRVDRLPSQLFKFNGNGWIEVDKELSDQHAYNDSYIDHLIEKISSGEYDPELLSNAERESIEQRLNNTKQG